MNIPAVWSFQRDDVAQAFDGHVRQQLPWYDLATDAVATVVRGYLTDGGLVYDIGASTGNIGRAIAPVLADRSARLVSIESSREMCGRYSGPGRLICTDALTHNYERFDVAVMFLTAMFLRPTYRPMLIERLMRRCNPGGVVVIVDKQRGRGGYAQTVMQRLTMVGKVAAGAPLAEIAAKELSLQGVQRPLDPRIFKHHRPVEFFRYGEFAGWLIEKPEI